MTIALLSIPLIEWFREYLGQEALHQRVRRTAQKEMVGEDLVRRCVAEEIGKRLEAKGAKETPEFKGLDKFSVRGRRTGATESGRVSG